MTLGYFSPKETQALLAQLNIVPKKKLGQNFLVDSNIVRKSIFLAGIQVNDVVVEVGPGLGTLTGALLDAGAHVYAVEYDPALFAHLKESVVLKYPDRFHVIHEDALKTPLAKLQDCVEIFKIVANLPYAISTPWLEKVLSGKLPKTMVLMLQKEAADRFKAEPGNKNFGAISIFLNAAYRTVGSHLVSNKCFYPVPDVGSVLLHLELKETPVVFNIEARKLIRNFFTQRRKQIGTICNAFKEILQVKLWQIWLEGEGLSLKLRPEVLPFHAWEHLNVLFS